MTRLDRLFVLLESGSTPATRKAAAQQLGEVQRLHPHELPFLLSRVHRCLRSNSWETRVAAGLAVEAILSKVPKWSQDVKTLPNVKVEPSSSFENSELSMDEESSSCIIKDDSKKQKLKFTTFDLVELTSNSGNFLMALDTKSFEGSVTGGAGKDDQRALINKRLGLDVAEKIGIDTSDIVSNDDLIESNESSLQETPAPSSLQLFDPNLEEHMSSRELNLAKRRARKQKLRESQQQAASVDGNGEAKRLKREDSIAFGDMSPESWSIYSVAEGQWPLCAWVEILLNDMFSPLWEVRHGAATALREVIKLHGNGGGREPWMSKDDSEKAHDEWMEDLALRLVSVLALDRFGDFVSDQVVAPVRETCSQCLGTVVSHMPPHAVMNVVQILVRLLQQKSWEVRHGALLGLKYTFAVRRDLVERLLPIAFPAVFHCLSDSVDDVSAVAASAFIPVADLLVETLPDKAPSVVNVLWDSLADLDDLSSACNSIMGLLATLLAFPKARSNLRELDLLIPRLWPFLHHTSSSVRHSSLLTLQKLTELDPSVSPMSVDPLQETLRHVYQRALLEHVEEVQNLIPSVWSDLLRSSKLDTLLLAACPCFGTWLCLAMQPPRLPLDPMCLLPAGRKGHAQQQQDGNSTSTPITEKLFIGGSGDGDPVVAAAARLRLTRMLGELASYIVQPLPSNGAGTEEPIELFVRVLMVHLNSRSALQKATTSFVISAWPDGSNDAARTNGSLGIVHNSTCIEATETLSAVKTKKCHPGLCKRLIECLQESVYFDEVAVGFSKLQSECRDFVATLKHYNIPLPPDIQVVEGNCLFSLPQIETLCGDNVAEVLQKNLKKHKIVDSLLERRKTICNLWTQTTSEFTALNTMTLAAISSAVISIGSSCLPDRLNPVVKPIMDSIRREENVLFQQSSANHLCILMHQALSREPCPNAKVVQNLVSYLCSDNSEIGLHASDESSADILSLSTLTGQESTKKLSKQEEQAEYEANKGTIIQKRGATLALKAIVKYFGSQLPKKVPRLWEMTFGILQQDIVDDDGMQAVINALLVLEIISPAFNKDLFPTISGKVYKLCSLLNHNNRAIRHMASRCLAVWALLMADKVMPVVAKELLPRMEAGGNDVARKGALEAVWCIVDKLGLDLLPYIVLLVVPVLGRMSDQDECIRMLASQTFATLVRLMPLEGGVPDPPNLPSDLSQQRSEQREFLEQLLNPSKISKYEITVPINAELRPYQQAGVNWLGFLNKFGLHGVLCDDMGLGKTLQSICILASDHKENEQRYQQNKVPDKKAIPSIVICPPTLTGHWIYEIEKFVGTRDAISTLGRAYLNPLHYHGPPTERNKLKSKVSSHNLVVASYDIVRNDIEFFSSIRWNYCILDEGHIIKNGKTKISKAIKQLRSNHRLILSGTPIQNNVLELWSLFDFLMPGFLGTERQFNQRFARPILMARDPKSSPKDQEAGALAMEALHRQALPFLLRRLKEDVLQDLPPKITQDYYCELSSIQEQLYDDFARTRAHQSLRDSFSNSNSDDPTKNSHIFQALQYLRKVCNHPKLVLTQQHPKYQSVMQTLQQTRSTLDDIQHSAKLPALKQLLLDCGIGVTECGPNSPESFNVVGEHRALIFCQLKVMLDILEHDLFKIHMPSVTYLRLDGSIPAGQRHSLVTRFNNDPSIDVLLLTTQVGGLGLNLTGADTVIFVEHDWNPMRDLQAMDRAHRIGQKKVVNVYRLITRGTLEEKIMGLQKFKLMTANTVISQENACIETMATDQLLDLFVLEDGGQSSKKEDIGGIVGAYKNVLENLPELWEDKLYEDEYDLSHFIKNLNR